MKMSVRLSTINDEDSENIEASVSFCDDDRDFFLRSASVDIWIKKEIIEVLPLSEIPRLAKKEALLFLQEVLSSHGDGT